MSYQGRSKHIEGISGGLHDVAGGRKVVGMLYEHIAGCSTSFRAYDAMWTYHRDHRQPGPQITGTTVKTGTTDNWDLIPLVDQKERIMLLSITRSALW